MVFAVAACAAHPTATNAPTGTPTRTLDAGQAGPTGPTERATVVFVNDGDTIRVEIEDGRGTQPVRYIGIDAPENGGPYVPVEPFGPEAKHANSEFVDQQAVVLEQDVSETDRFGRLLRYVWLDRPDGWLMVNEELVRQGLATVTTFPPDVRYVDRLRAVQQAARDAGRGVWSAD